MPKIRPGAMDPLMTTDAELLPVSTTASTAATAAATAAADAATAKTAAQTASSSAVIAAANAATALTDSATAKADAATAKASATTASGDAATASAAALALSFYDLPGGLSGTPSAGEVALAFVTVRAFHIPAGAGAHKAVGGGPYTTTNQVYHITKNGSLVGTLTFAAASTTGTFSFASRVDYAPGDVIGVQLFSTPDPNFVDLLFTLAGLL
jgi:hypothetical protein